MKKLQDIGLQINKILLFIYPLIYLIFWYSIPISIAGIENVDITALTYMALPVLFIGLISKQTSWSIGGNNGIRGDNIGKKVRATIDRKGSFEIDGMDLSEEKVEQVISAVMDNPVYTDKQKQ